MYTMLMGNASSSENIEIHIRVPYISERLTLCVKFG